jgi:hypothetical protein
VACGFNDTNCVAVTEVKYPPGLTFSQYINPADPAQRTDKQVTYNETTSFFCFFFAALLGLFAIPLYMLMILVALKNISKAYNGPPAAPKKKPIASRPKRKVNVNNNTDDDGVHSMSFNV